MAKYEIHGNVGQHIDGAVIRGGIHTKIVMDDEGNMTVETVIGGEDGAE